MSTPPPDNTFSLLLVLQIMSPASPLAPGCFVFLLRSLFNPSVFFCLSAGLDLTSMTDDPSFTGSDGCGQRMAQEEPLDAILSPELDKMVTDGEFECPGFE